MYTCTRGPVKKTPLTQCQPITLSATARACRAFKNAFLPAHDPLRGKQVGANPFCPPADMKFISTIWDHISSFFNTGWDKREGKENEDGSPMAPTNSDAKRVLIPPPQKKKIAKRVRYSGKCTLVCCSLICHFCKQYVGRCMCSCTWVRGWVDGVQKTVDVHTTDMNTAGSLWKCGPCQAISGGNFDAS